MSTCQKSDNNFKNGVAFERLLDRQIGSKLKAAKKYVFSGTVGSMVPLGAITKKLSLGDCVVGRFVKNSSSCLMAK